MWLRETPSSSIVCNDHLAAPANAHFSLRQCSSQRVAPCTPGNYVWIHTVKRVNCCRPLAWLVLLHACRATSHQRSARPAGVTQCHYHTCTLTRVDSNTHPAQSHTCFTSYGPVANTFRPTRSDLHVHAQSRAWNFQRHTLSQKCILYTNTVIFTPTLTWIGSIDDQSDYQMTTHVFHQRISFDM